MAWKNTADFFKVKIKRLNTGTTHLGYLDKKKLCDIQDKPSEWLDKGREEEKDFSSKMLSVFILPIAIFSGKAFVGITATMKFKDCILLEEASFYCDRDQIWLGKGDHQVPSCQLSDGCCEVWLVLAGLWESVFLLAQEFRNCLNIWGCELIQWKGFGLLTRPVL